MRPAFNARNDTPLTGRPTPGRSIATAWLEMDEIRQLGRLTRSTLNDVALSCIDGAFHRYLEDRGMPTRGCARSGPIWAASSNSSRAFPAMPSSSIPSWWP